MVVRLTAVKLSTSSFIVAPQRQTSRCWWSFPSIPRSLQAQGAWELLNKAAWCRTFPLCIWIFWHSADVVFPHHMTRNEVRYGYHWWEPVCSLSLGCLHSVNANFLKLYHHNLFTKNSNVFMYSKVFWCILFSRWGKFVCMASVLQCIYHVELLRQWTIHALPYTVIIFFVVRIQLSFSLWWE